MRTVIAADRENATAEAQALATGALHVYTNGSGIDGHAGAAAALYDGRRHVSDLKFHLGTLQEHTVYESESIGATLGLHLAMQYIRRSGVKRDIFVHIDNQPVVRAVRRIKPRPGYHYIKHIRVLARQAAEQLGVVITMVWTPGHEGIEGNERADELARDAAEGKASRSDLLP